METQKLNTIVLELSFFMINGKLVCVHLIFQIFVYL